MPAYSFKVLSQLQLQGSIYTFPYKFLKAMNTKKANCGMDLAQWLSWLECCPVHQKGFRADSWAHT